MEPRGGTPFVWAIFTLGVEIAFFHLFCCSPYNRRNTLLRCGNPRSFTQSKLPRVFLARLVLLGSKKSSVPLQLSVLPWSERLCTLPSSFVPAPRRACF